MLSSIYTSLIHRNLSVIRIVNHNPCYYLHQLHPFSSAIPKPISDSTKHDSPLVNYLVKTFGFSQEKAFTIASKHSKTSDTKKPELVRQFLENQGLTADQIRISVRYYPRMLFLNPQKAFLPKFEFFRSVGIPQIEVNQIFFKSPDVFRRSLTRHIVPCLSYLRTLFESSGVSFGFTRCVGVIFRCAIESQLIPNVGTLRGAGVPDSKIVRLLQINPQAVIVDRVKFRKVVEEVKQRKICPSTSQFVIAVWLLNCTTKATWDAKVATYKKWGWSEDDVRSAFQRFPLCMTASTDKITKLMNFMVNEMGFDSSPMLKNPIIIMYNLEKRIKPRCLVYKTLVQNGLIKEIPHLSNIFNLTEDKFLKKFVHRYKTKAPGLLQLYREKKGLSKS